MWNCEESKRKTESKAKVSRCKNLFVGNRFDRLYFLSEEFESPFLFGKPLMMAMSHSNSRSIE